ncbi:MAG: hypothetical protein HZB13_10815 [Acidobacteria bacterium]|nr:hypothetical protein [Acidobacteriota bacterium]
MRAKRSIRYKALPSQQRFHRSKARFKGFSGPIGSGKSQALCHEAIRMAYLNAGRAGLIGAPTFQMLRDATQSALFSMMRESGIPFDFNKAENTVRMKDTGSKIIFRPLDDFERLRGTNLAWFGVDELTYTPREAWVRLEGRLRDPQAKRLCGFGVWTPKGFDWVYDCFIHSPVKGYECVQAAPFENRFLLKQVPDFYDRLKHSYDEGFFAQEVLGEYLNPGEGLVYHAFDRRQNVAEVARDVRRPLLWALDFNVNPMSSVVAQVDEGTVKVLDEIVLTRASTRAACEEFSRRYPKWPGGLVIYADACATHMQTAGTTDKEIVEDFFDDLALCGAGRRPEYRIPKKNPPVRDRVGLVNAKMKSADGEISLLVHPKCTELVADFERVQWLAGTSEIDKARDPRRTHLSDALGYLIWQEFQPRHTVGERSQRLFW